MSEPIYKFFMGRFVPDWYQLSQKQQKSLLAKLQEAREKVGAKTMLIRVRTRGLPEPFYH